MSVLNAVGVLLAATAAAAAILLPAGRLRAAAMLAALALFPALILGDRWHSHQIVDLRDHPARLAALGAAALLVSAALATAFRRWPRLLPLAIVFALPFRVPLHAGGDTANLLVPLYLVIAGGVLSLAVRDLRPRPRGEASDRAVSPAGGAVGGTIPEEASATAGDGGSPAATGPAGQSAWSLREPARQAAAWLPRVLALVVVLYALQTLYSPSPSKSLQNVCFFFVPFSLVYALLRDVEWDRRLLAAVLWVVAIEGVAFVAVGSIEYRSRSLFWNHQVIRSNAFHTYFRVNSVFWDPNIYGRWLALAIVAAMSALLWTRQRRNLILLTVLVAVLWLGLAPTFSQSSFAALLAGLAVLAALRWSVKWTAITAVTAVAASVLLIVASGGFSLSKLNPYTSGRANLISGGVHLFAQRPVYGYGSGSFPKAYTEHVRTRKVPVSVSHTEPVTVAAEQGAVGLIAYAALIFTALWTMSFNLLLPRGGWRRRGNRPRGSFSYRRGRWVPCGDRTRRATPTALATAGGGGSPAATGPARPHPVARAAVLAAFIALLIHTLAYAGFFEDPITWVLLAVGASLAVAPRSAPPHSLDPCRATSAA